MESRSYGKTCQKKKTYCSLPHISSYLTHVWQQAWNIGEGTELFTQVQDAGGNYASKAHLAEMIALLGPPPKKLLVMSESMAQAEWSPTITDDSGKVYENNRDYFGGPFFDGEGKITGLQFR